MSDLRVALIAEGPTDAVIIEAALNVLLLPRTFVMTTLQPEPTRPKLGAGWGGVLRWCRDFASRGHGRIVDDPTLPGFDLFILHVDADVAEGSYADLGQEIAELAGQQRWPALPHVVPCPPPEGGVDAMRQRLLAWAGLRETGPKVVLCVPSKATDTWLAAALLGDADALMRDLECNRNVVGQLEVLPKAKRVKKTVREYRARAVAIAGAWSTVRRRCSQAERFSSEVHTASA